MTVNRQESETISKSRAQLESQVSASPSNIGAADVHRDYERVKESVCRISIPNQYKVQDSATGVKQDCKPVLKVVTKCARVAETGMKIMSQMPDNHGDVVSINKSDLEKLFIVFNAQCEYLKSEYASLEIKSNCNYVHYYLNYVMECTRNIKV